MSEQNILNATQTSPFNPTYSLRIDDGDDEIFFQARSGAPYMRRVDVRGRVYTMRWNMLQFSDAMALKQFDHQYRDGFFSYQDFDQSRYFTGRFIDKLKMSADGNNNYSFEGIFTEIPGLAMFAYPSNWARDAIFWEQNDDFGNARTKQTGVWTPATNANAHGAATDELTNTNLNTTDMVELVYTGYGFRLWARKDSNLGIFSVQTTRDGAAEVASTNVDLYAAAPAAAAAVFTSTNMVLGKHRVIITATNTKNASSSAKTILFDAIEIMQ
jgi:hypothetical protein